MKNKIKSILCFSALLALGACATNDKEPIASPNGFELRKDATITSAAVLAPANDADTFAAFTWDESDNGMPTVASYSLVVSDHDADPTFANAVAYTGNGITVTPEARACTLKNSEFNDLMNQLPSFSCGVMNIDVRIKSVLGINNQLVQYSNPITFAVNGYSTALPILSLVKEGSNVATAPQLKSQNFTSLSTFEGYFYLEAGSYKLYRPDPCGSFASPTIYGGTAGVLTSGAAAPSISVATAGHYLVKADISAGGMTYSIKFYKGFGLFGTAKGTLGSANAVPMTDTDNSNVWKLTLELFKGRKFKFKSNDWTAALSGNPPSVPSGSGTTIISVLGKGTVANSVIELTTGGEITVPGSDDGTKVKYDIVLDVSNPRNYLYSLEVNPN
ncbi:MAG: hypothetical protein RL699_1910 [Bacteroidota bacterium]|jgi:hypothetical protein